MPAILDVGLKVIDKLFPDPKAAESAKMELLRMQLDGRLAELAAETKIAEAQTQTNNIEATSANIWQAGWRPGAGWVGVFGLAYAAVVQPFLSWFSASQGWPLPPTLDDSLLGFILTGMLGLGAYRSFEKTKGVAS
jgi:hypothetical protein